MSSEVLGVRVWEVSAWELACLNISNMFRNIKRYSELIKTDKESRNYIHNYSNSVTMAKRGH